MQSWATLVQAHARRYPLWQRVDLYKLIYQAVLGSEHALTNASKAWAYLQQEWATLPPGPPDEPLFEPLRPEIGLGRLNLRPYKAQGGTVEQLWQAFMAGAARTWGTLEDLQITWDEVIVLAQVGAVAFAPADLRAFGQAQRAAGFPPVHHSSMYRAAYRPAYRLVWIPAWGETGV